MCVCVCVLLLVVVCFIGLCVVGLGLCCVKYTHLCNPSQCGLLGRWVLIINIVIT